MVEIEHVRIPYLEHERDRDGCVSYYYHQNLHTNSPNKRSMASTPVYIKTKHQTKKALNKSIRYIYLNHQNKSDSCYISRAIFPRFEITQLLSVFYSRLSRYLHHLNDRRSNSANFEAILLRPITRIFRATAKI